MLSSPRVQRVPDPHSSSQPDPRRKAGFRDVPLDSLSTEALRSECRSLLDENAEMRRTLDDIAEVINGRPEKLLHDVRNVMNELVLLRKLADED